MDSLIAQTAGLKIHTPQPSDFHHISDVPDAIPFSSRFMVLKILAWPPVVGCYYRPSCSPCTGVPKFSKKGP